MTGTDQLRRGQVLITAVVRNITRLEPIGPDHRDNDAQVNDGNRHGGRALQARDQGTPDALPARTPVGTRTCARRLVAVRLRACPCSAAERTASDRPVPGAGVFVIPGPGHQQAPSCSASAPRSMSATRHRPSVWPPERTGTATVNWKEEGSLLVGAVAGPLQAAARGGPGLS